MKDQVLPADIQFFFIFFHACDHRIPNHFNVLVLCGLSRLNILASKEFQNIFMVESKLFFRGDIEDNTPVFQVEHFKEILHESFTGRAC